MSNSQIAIPVRIEADPLGEVAVPVSALYGAQTARAVDNFRVTGRTIASMPELVRMLAVVKQAAAMANLDDGALTPEQTDAIVAACDEVIAGLHDADFVVDPLQGGAGTSTNMNMNEVLAARATQILRVADPAAPPIHANDHVNRSQSTNDAYASAALLAADILMADLAEGAADLVAAIHAKAAECGDVAKLGRTQLQDAVPMTIGLELRAFAASISRSIEEVEALRPVLLELNLGGTAIGTGVGASPVYRQAVFRHLAEISGKAVRPARDPVSATSDAGAFVACAGAAKRLAIRLGKMASDLRLLSSGPRGGLGELRLPPVQPGSSIMPGKVNPVIPELVNQVCYRAHGHELTISLAAQAAQLQLNAMFPVIYMSLSETVSELRAAMDLLARRCIRDLAVDQARCRANLDASTALAVNLVPSQGYGRAAEIAYEALSQGTAFMDFLARTHPDLVAIADPLSRQPTPQEQLT